MLISEFNKGFYKKIYILIACIVVAILVYSIYVYNQNMFDITKIQHQLDSGAKEVFKQKISWEYQDKQLVGKIYFKKARLQLIYYLNKKKIGYQMVQQDSNKFLQLPCLNIVQVLPVATTKLLYQKLFSNIPNYTTSKSAVIKQGMLVDYKYKVQNNNIITSCFIYYK